MFRHDHRADTELACDFTRMQAARTAKRDQREIARVVAALNRYHANGALHVGVGDAENSRRRSHTMELQFLSDAIDGPCGAVEVNGHLATEQLPCVDASQPNMRAGNRG